MSKHRASLSGLLTLYIGGGLLLMIFLWGLLIRQGVTGLVESELEDTARALARQLATVSLDAVLLQDYGTLERFVSDLVGQAHVRSIRIERSDGELLAEAEHVGLPGESRSISLNEPITLLDGEIGRVHVVYAVDSAYSLASRLTLLGAAVAGLLGALVFFVLRRVLSRRLIRPVALLAEGVSPLRASPRLPDDAPEELASLVASFEQMRGELQAHLAARDRALQFAREATERLMRDRQLAITGQLAAGVAHGLNTPLGNIIGYCQMAREALDSSGGMPHVQEHLAIIERQAASCARIVRDLMAAAREPAAEATLVDLASQLKAGARLVQPLLKGYGVDALDIHCAETLCAWADPATLEHVLFNLLTNAAQAGARQLALVCGEDGECVFIDVRDDGLGVPEHLRERLFEPFVTSKNAGEGTGLGLYMCRILLGSLGGDIVLQESRPGETVFRIYLRRP